MSNGTLAERLDRMTIEGWLCEPERDGAVRCVACGHRCLIRPGKRGICQVRFNRDGKLMVPYGYVAGLQSDPIEKKPFFHVYPGSNALTFGMLGCDLHCDYCQNWLTSQALRDEAAGVMPTPIRIDQIIEMARQTGARSVISSYNEPLITSEWAIDIFRQAKPAGFLCGYVSNGNATPEVLDALRPWADCYKIDLKTMNDRNYRQLGAVLDRILDGIRMVYERGFWLEIVTLIVPGFNDSEGELREMARFIASLSPDIPWHVTAFHKDYKMTEPENTTASDLRRAAAIGREEGLRYVYAGNLPGQVGDLEHTRCHNCGKLLIERYGFMVASYEITVEGTCPQCGERIPGIWYRTEEERRHAASGHWLRRMPRSFIRRP
ncbi:MAG: AmmeMemoRadiSam system radical SAM enzyme [Anaerolineae bacterium]